MQNIESFLKKYIIKAVDDNTDTRKPAKLKTHESTRRVLWYYYYNDSYFKRNNNDISWVTAISNYILMITSMRLLITES